MKADITIGGTYPVSGEMNCIKAKTKKDAKTEPTRKAISISS